MFTATVDPSMPTALIGSRTDPSALNDFLAYYGAINPFSEPAKQMYRDGDVRYGQELLSNEQLVRTEFYQDFFLPQGMHHSFGIQSTLVNDGFVYVSSQRPRDEDPFGAREGRVLQTLFPHILRAFTMRQRMGATESVVNAVSAVLDAMDHAVFGVDAVGRISFSNRRAEAIASTGDVIEVRQGRLRCVVPSQDGLLQALLAQAMQVGHAVTTGSGGAVEVCSADGVVKLRAVMTPSLEASGVGDHRTVALISLHTIGGVPSSRDEVLHALFRLTPVERRLAAHLLDGYDLKECAVRMRITSDTARFHMKRLLFKTGTRKQAELIRLMTSLPGTYQPPSR